jgi:hypothetical protein
LDTVARLERQMDGHRAYLADKVRNRSGVLNEPSRT